MRELNVWNQCRYPGFSEDAADGFRELTHDLAFANDFLCGDAAVLRNAAAKEALKAAKQDQQIMAVSVGDVRKLEEMRDHFRGARYGDVIRLAAELKYPDQMSSSEQRMIKLAGERANSHHAAVSQ
jgi:hypothetical protein